MPTKHILWFLTLILALTVSACGSSASQPSAQQPVQQEASANEAMADKEEMSDEAMTDKEEMSDEAMSDEAMADEAMADKDEMSDETMADEAMAEKDADGEMMSDEAMADKDEMSDEAMSDEAMAEKDTDGEMMSDEAMADKEEMSDEAMSDEAMAEKDADGEMMADEAMADKEEMSDEAMTDETMAVPVWFNAELTDVNTGETFKVADFKGKVVLVETMAVWCPLCTGQQGQIQALHNTLGDRDDLISLSLDIDPNESSDILKTHTERNGFDWIYAVAPSDVAREIGQLYGAQYLNPPATPMFIIDRQGEVHQLPFGHKVATALADALQPFLNDAG